MFKSLLSLPALLLSLGAAHAGLLPSLAVTDDGDSGAYRFTYSVELQSKAVLQPGDYFTVYDFAGRFEGTETQPDHFVFSSDLFGPTPGQLNPNDDPAIPNLTWTYTGTGTLTGETWLGEFSVVSEFGDTRSDNFTGQSHRLTDGCFNNNITDTDVPVPSSVPEPATWVLAAVAAVGLAGYGWRRKAVTFA